MSGLLKTFSQSVAAGSITAFHVAARNFRLLAGANMTVRFYSNGAEVGTAEGVDSGFYLLADEIFDEVRLESPTAQAIKFTTGSGEAGAATAVSISGAVEVTNDVGNPLPVSGTVNEISPAVSYSQTQHTVGVASALLKAANANRKFLLVQNNHASQNIWLALNGGAATIAGGVKIAPGGSLLLDRVCPTNNIYAIGEVGDNTAVIVVEG